MDLLLTSELSGGFEDRGKIVQYRQKAPSANTGAKSWECDTLQQNLQCLREVRPE